MAATTVGGVEAQDKPLLDVKWLTFAFLLYTVFYLWVRWYEGVYGWSAGLDSFAPEFETYWMNFLYTEIVLEVITASILWGWMWKTRDRNMAAMTPREELRRNMTHLIWLFAYAWAIYWGASYFTEQDGTWHQTIVRDTDFTPSHIIEFYLSYPIYIITGVVRSCMRTPACRTSRRRPRLSLAYLILWTGPFMILPNVG